MKKILLILAVLLSLAVTSNAQVVNINSVSNHDANPVSLLFSAGTYDVTPIGKADGGWYNAWSAWPFNDDCDANGENCRQGWLNLYYISSSEFGVLTTGDGGIYETDILAFSNAQSTSFSLSTEATVDFFIRDGTNGSGSFNNRDGISLDISPAVAPEPISSTLFIVGGAALGFRHFRKRK